MTDPERRSEADKLWAAVKRGYFVAVETFAGIRRDEGDARWTRLLKNWRALCTLDIAVATQLVHGLREVSIVLDADHRGPADSHLQQLDEMLGTAKHPVSTPVNWKRGDDVIIAPALSDADAKQKFPDGWKTPLPYIRLVPDPSV